VTGRLATDFYFYERGDSSHARPYVRLNADWNIWRGRARQTVTLRTHLRWTTDLGDQPASDPQLFVYDTYLRFADIVPGLRVDAGRQFVFSGIGSAHLDGLQARYDHRWFMVDVYGGSWVSRLDPETVRSLNDYGAWGGQLYGKIGRTFRVGAHLTGQREVGFMTRHRAGLTAEYMGRTVNLIARYAYDLLSGVSTSFLTRIRYSAQGWTTDAEYGRREPAIAYNNLFSLIDSSPYNEFRVTIQRRITGYTSVLAGGRVTTFDSESAVRGRLGVTSPYYALIGLLQSGDRGELVGVQGHLTPRPSSRLQPFLRFSINRYAVQTEQDGTSDAHSVAVGAAWRGSGMRTLRAEVQYLRNAVETSDLRLFVQFVQGFRWNPSSGGGAW
jgi:hypothetical protein